ncbi:MAG: CDP-diacylglycerol--serine O-phosphatidyltransferase [Planctomycetes bacterium]|nr:CDP-diacylglycerol--serine O-phosphatidyltransferase [Planctomycetota bacterium]
MTDQADNHGGDPVNPANLDNNQDEFEDMTPEMLRRRELRRIRRHRRRQFILRSTAVLPALLTVMNGVCGFAAIYFATKDAIGVPINAAAGRGVQVSQLFTWNPAIAAWLIFAAMVFDMLDGRLARLTRRTSDFGGQLDSLCDAISFGVAPAILMLRTVVTAMPDMIHEVAVERGVWCIAAIFMACAVLRLARFNVENEPDEAAHMKFKGLPSPGAAAVVAILVLLFAHLTDRGWLDKTFLAWIYGFALPIVTMAAALLMVSNFEYPHLINQYLRGKRSFGYIVRLMVIAAALVLEFIVTASAIIVVFVLSGPVRAVFRRPGDSAAAVFPAGPAAPPKPPIITPPPDHPKLPPGGDSQK